MHNGLGKLMIGIGILLVLAGLIYVLLEGDAIQGRFDTSSFIPTHASSSTIRLF